MFLLKSDFCRYLLIYMLVVILLGTFLVSGGGFIADRYFSRMVTGLLGDYGEYDYLFTLSGDKEDMALPQIENVIDSKLKGAELESGPEVAGSSNYFLRLPEKYKNEKVFSEIDQYFADIPGMMSKTVMTEPRLTLRGFRGGTLTELRSLIDEIEGIDFAYRAGDGLDIIVKSPEEVTHVRNEIEKLLESYSLVEVRYPLNQGPENIDVVKEEIMSAGQEVVDSDRLTDVTDVEDTDQMMLFRNLRDMKQFLLSYATKVKISGIESEYPPGEGEELIVPESGEGDEAVLQVIESDDDNVTALISSGEISGEEVEVYTREMNGGEGEFLGTGEVNNPRQELSEALDKLNDISPRLEGFLEQSEQLVEYSDLLDSELESVSGGLSRLEGTSQQLNSSLQEWEERDLTVFLQDLDQILEELEGNLGNLDEVQSELVVTSNRLREAASLIEERIAYIPRNNSLYDQLDELKDMFLQLSRVLDENYDVVAERIENTDPLMSSIDEWKVKLESLMRVEDTLNDGARWEEVGEVIEDIESVSSTVDTRELQDNLSSIQEILVELETTQMPAVLDQLTYIQDSLPDMEEEEIVETIDLIDEYIAGQVIPGDQIQIMVSGDFDKEEMEEALLPVAGNPAASFSSMDVGMLQPNPRGEVYNILRQVEAVISIIVALVFTFLVMLLDQTLLISVLKLQGNKGYFYSFASGALIFTLIYYGSGINFPYFNLFLTLFTGGLIGFVTGLFSSMLNPVSRAEWEAGKAFGFSPGEIMREIIIPAGKPGLLYLSNRPRIILH
ncbi:MAG: hypothetical protein ACOCZM_00250 [Bacillota bacterium]